MVGPQINTYERVQFEKATSSWKESTTRKFLCLWVSAHLCSISKHVLHAQVSAEFIHVLSIKIWCLWSINELLRVFILYILF